MTPRRRMVASNQLRARTRSTLSNMKNDFHRHFDAWLNQFNKSSRVQLDDLPASRFQSRESHISKDRAQLFVNMDTCELVNNRNPFIDYIRQLRLMFGSSSPIKIVLPLMVFEELDKCNRRSKRNARSSERSPGSANRSRSSGSNQRSPYLVKQERNTPSTIDPKLGSDPPRGFMRIIEEELRRDDIVIGELDPFKEVQLSHQENFEILNSDDRILASALRTKKFIERLPHHPDTQVILVTQDNVFKAKCSVFGLPSYRWSEFVMKFKNYGHEHYTSSPRPAASQSQSANYLTGSAADRLPLARIYGANLAGAGPSEVGQRGRVSRRRLSLDKSGGAKRSRRQESHSTTVAKIEPVSLESDGAGTPRATDSSDSSEREEQQPSAKLARVSPRRRSSRTTTTKAATTGQPEELQIVGEIINLD